MRPMPLSAPPTPGPKPIPASNAPTDARFGFQNDLFNIVQVPARQPMPFFPAMARNPILQNTSLQNPNFPPPTYTPFPAAYGPYRGWEILPHEYGGIFYPDQKCEHRWTYMAFLEILGRLLAFGQKENPNFGSDIFNWHFRARGGHNVFLFRAYPEKAKMSFFPGFPLKVTEKIKIN